MEKTKNIDYKLFFAVLLLIVFGLMMISSVSVYSSFEVTSDSMTGNIYNYFYLKKSIGHIFLSLFLLFIMTKVNVSFFEKNAKYFYTFALVLLMLVLVKWLSLKWASWWLDIPWLPSIQPTEFAKVAIIVFLAFFLKKYNWLIKTFTWWLLPFLLITGSMTLLVWLQPDFWTLLIILPVLGIMYFSAGASYKHILWLLAIWLVFFWLIYVAWDYDKKTGKRLNSLWYITLRVDNLFGLNEFASSKKSKYQTEQWLIAIGSGWFSGKGFWNSIQKYGYLPEAQWDLIFAIIVEELWFLGGFGIIIIYLFIGYRGYRIAYHVQDSFAKYAAIGITSRILFQAFINIWVTLNVVPLTWVTLPFVSYGGSSMLSLWIGLWVLLCISREIDDGTNYSRLKRNKFML